MRIREPQHRRLASLDLFAGCTADQIGAIDRLGTEIAVPAGRRIWREDRTEAQLGETTATSARRTRSNRHSSRHHLDRSPALLAHGGI